MSREFVLLKFRMYSFLQALVLYLVDGGALLEAQKGTKQMLYCVIAVNKRGIDLPTYIGLTTFAQ